jgi:hypothetical protein
VQVQAHVIVVKPYISILKNFQIKSAITSPIAPTQTAGIATHPPEKLFETLCFVAVQDAVIPNV